MAGDTFEAFGTAEDFRGWIEFRGREALAKFFCAFAGGDRNDFRAVLRGLFGCELDVRARGDGDDFEFARERVHDLETLAANRAGGAENGDAFHSRINVSQGKTENFCKRLL